MHCYVLRMTKLKAVLNTTGYLNRINFPQRASVDLETLHTLHEYHVLSIPFENLDIQNKIEIRLEKKHLFKKIVENVRGGFCYELNYLFSSLLLDLGFDVTLISARIFDGEEVGPEFDHMALIIKLGKKNWLADVGFGDLFTKPLDIETAAEQFDGRNYFKIKRWEKGSFLLTMSKNGVEYEKKYLFKTKRKAIEDFSAQCAFKQYTPASYFVKNIIVTLPIENGRKTIFNSKYIVKENGAKTELTINSKKEEACILKKEFNIQINAVTDQA